MEVKWSDSWGEGRRGQPAQIEATAVALKNSAQNTARERRIPLSGEEYRRIKFEQECREALLFVSNKG